MAVSTNRVNGTEDAELDARALGRYMTVLEDADARTRADASLYSVTSDSGSEYLVDIDVPACECPDHQYRDRRCIHIRRVEFATGRRAIPTWADSGMVDPQLGDHVDDVGGDDDAA